ncbi:hypothetical protein KS4_20790 [Poriferisphaera corsica]|uniref:Uncharacterized protein n=1 Tax=Poriferisphaera corsica TaxID=2528020 RepID=A0A517YUU4_9BACT|nr:hypothetical protein [Poriferisphaera corsica]QDU34018.1 hypothetical protein KS4_20790 [Poriferisphaera corsica]
MSAPVITIINVMSLPFSGGTWLNLMLGAGEDAFSIGEYRDVIYKGQGYAECVTHDTGCEVWPKVDVNDESADVFLQLAEVTGKKVLVVNGSRKTFEWQRHQRIRPVVLYLQRDMRALVASALRKNVHGGFMKTLRSYAHEEVRMRKIIKRSGFEPVSVLSYEKLKADTAGELQRVSQELGVAFDEGQLSYWEKDHCYIGGNRGTLLNMLVQQDKQGEHILKKHQQSGDIKWDFSTYSKKQDLACLTDERWRKELSQWQKFVIDMTLLPFSQLMRLGI